MSVREQLLSLAASGLRMPIGTDLVLHEHSDAQAIMLDGERLGKVVETAARRYNTPVAVPLMDLRLEKADLVSAFGIPAVEVDTFHFNEAPEGTLDPARPFAQRNQANIDAVRYIATRTDLLPVGMLIGPFSLTTKLMTDPISAVAMAGGGMTAEEDGSIGILERCLALSEQTVHRSVEAQVRAGAKAVIVCEPAANRVYLSPRQIQSGSDIFERFVMQPNLRMLSRIRELGAELIFHNCGELTNPMVEQFAQRLHPAMLSLGSSRKLWEDAALVPKDVVLYGNLPTKNFYSDEALPAARVEELTAELLAKMTETGHPYILGSECDVLHVPEAAQKIRNKVELMLRARPAMKTESPVRA
jgi:uroporphyrinogen-III decarboxylase